MTLRTTPTTPHRRLTVPARRLTAVAAVMGLALVGGCTNDDATPAGQPASAQAPSDTPAAAQTPGNSPSAAPSTSATPGVSTPVPAPTPGSITSTVAARPEASATPVAIDTPAEVASRVRVQISQVKAIQAKAEVPGDVAGPAVQFSVTVVNDSQRAVPTDNVVVNVTGSDKRPAVLLQGPPTKLFTGQVAPGSKAVGVFAARVAPGARKPVTIEVSVDPALPVATFRGNVG